MRMEHLLVNRRKGEFPLAGEIFSFAETLMSGALLTRGEAARASAPATAHAMSILLAAAEGGGPPDPAHAEIDRLRPRAEGREGPASPLFSSRVQPNRSLATVRI